MTTLAARVARFLRGGQAVDHSAHLDEAIIDAKKRMLQNGQSLQSGARVMQNWSGALRMMTEADSEEHGR